MNIRLITPEGVGMNGRLLSAHSIGRGKTQARRDRAPNKFVVMGERKREGMKKN